LILVDKTKNAALVKCNLWGTKEVKPMMVKLKKQKEGWRIDSIYCHGHNFESLYNRIKEEHPRLFPKRQEMFLKEKARPYRGG
jgi:hypothetical protein